MALGDHSRRQGAERHADDEDGDGQRRQGGVGRQRAADDGAGGIDHHRIGSGQGLGDGEAQHIGALMRIGGGRESGGAGRAGM